MDDLEKIKAILDRIAKGKYTSTDLESLRQFLITRNSESFIQLGKNIVGKIDGREIQIGDRIYQGASAETIRNVLKQILDESRPNPNVLMNQGIKFLDSKSYLQAIETLKEAIKADRSRSEAYFYLALALLQGKRPKLLTRNKIEEIDQLLSTAIVNSNNIDGTLYWFRALVRDDYYNGYHMICPQPSVIELVREASSRPTSITKLTMLLSRLPMSNNQLYLELIKQLNIRR